MCGFMSLYAQRAPLDSSLAGTRMAGVRAAIDAIRHRGPDEQRFWQDEEVALGFARLAIVDLVCGSQPMTNETGRLQLVFNGEIYNHLALRRELTALGHRFATDHSDSEVILHGWEEWREELLPRLNGMFAFVLWDQDRRELVVARDRYGVKPLYYARAGDAWLFASEIKAILATGLLEARRNDQAVAEYLFQQNTWGEATFFDGIFEFPKAQFWVLRDGKPARKSTFWSSDRPRDCTLGYAQALERHRELLGVAVQSQMMADVPVMSYLSGGIDSSAITALATRSRDDVAAYACLFDLESVGADRINDEREFSRAAAAHLGIQLNELLLSPRSLETALDPTIRALETPRMGMAYVNYLIAQRVAADGKVVLSGTGGDEFHAGYIGRYDFIETPPLPPGGRISRRLRALVGKLMPKDPHAGWQDRYRQLLNFPVRHAQAQQAFEPGFLASVDVEALVVSMADRLQAVASRGPTDAMLHLDSATYLHGLLVMEDKVSMAHSLEARVPLLDNDLVDFLLSLPVDYLRAAGVGKKIFRDSVAPLLPETIVRKPKMGFGPPDASWYRNQLRPFVEGRLLEGHFRENGVLRPAFVQEQVATHMDGSRNNLPFLWSALSLQSWTAQFQGAGRQPAGEPLAQAA